MLAPGLYPPDAAEINFDRAIVNLYTRGIIRSVSMVENPIPHTIVLATGPQSKDSPPSPIAREERPAIVVNEVINIGTTRRRAA